MRNKFSVPVWLSLTIIVIGTSLCIAGATTKNWLKIVFDGHTYSASLYGVCDGSKCTSTVIFYDCTGLIITGIILTIISIVVHLVTLCRLKPYDSRTNLPRLLLISAGTLAILSAVVTFIACIIFGKADSKLDNVGYYNIEADMDYSFFLGLFGGILNVLGGLLSLLTAGSMPSSKGVVHAMPPTVIPTTRHPSVYAYDQEAINTATFPPGSQQPYSQLPIQCFQISNVTDPVPAHHQAALNTNPQAFRNENPQAFINANPQASSNGKSQVPLDANHQAANPQTSLNTN